MMAYTAKKFLEDRQIHRYAATLVQEALFHDQVGNRQEIDRMLACANRYLDTVSSGGQALGFKWWEMTYED